jgi:signal transduction histidine kinase
MEGIVTGLLQLLRNEPPQKGGHTPTPLHAVIDAATSTVESRVRLKHLRLTCSVPDAVMVDARPELLRSIVNNLLDNAVEYSPTSGTIVIEGRAEASRVVLRVANDVEGLRDEDLPRLFDRFWRRDAARTATGHFGLGLPIARSFAEAMGCELVATLETPSRITLTLSGLRIAAA